MPSQDAHLRLKEVSKQTMRYGNTFIRGQKRLSLWCLGWWHTSQLRSMLFDSYTLWFADYFWHTPPHQNIQDNTWTHLGKGTEKRHS
jgi:hypothetical protein